MKREVVRDFLNLPGIAGVALMDGRSRPYFCGVDQALNFQQKEALAQGIRQVVETTPEDFESFEFQFTKHQVYIYKLERGMILLVLAKGDLVQSDYQASITRLKSGLQADISKAIITFRLLASDISLPGSPQKEVETQSTSVALEALAEEPVIPPLSTSVHATPASANLDSTLLNPPNGEGSLSVETQSTSVALEALAEEPVTPPLSASVYATPVSANLDSTLLNPQNGEGSLSTVKLSEFTDAAKPPITLALLPETDSLESDLAATSQPTEAVELSVSIKEILAAMNQLSQFTVQYLGTAVISNYWKSSRPNQDWLKMFQIDRKAQFSLVNTPSGENALTLDAEQQKWIKEWVNAFVERCAKVIRNFPSLIESSLLSDRQKSLLLHTQ